MLRSANVVVVGAGPAGIAAATAAAKQGRTVLVLDDNPAPGGQIWRQGMTSAQASDDGRKKAAFAALRSSGAEVLPDRTVVDTPQTGVLRVLAQAPTGLAPEDYRWEHLILAAGARERFLPFPGWTLPGVFGAGGLQALAKNGFAVKGKRVVVAGTGPLLLAVAVHLQEFGAKIVVVAEQAPMKRLLPFAASLLSHPAKLMQGAGYRRALGRAPYRTGCWPIAATGDETLHSVRLTDGRRVWDEECDLLACGFHLVPNTELASLLGCRLNDGLVEVDANQQTSVQGVFCAGEPTGIAGLEAALVQGEIAGLAASGNTPAAASLYARSRRERSFGSRLNKAFSLRPELRTLAAPDTLVCRCEDVSYARLEQCLSWTDAKLQTRCGMGPCQGRICGPAVQTIFGWHPSSVRPPIFPAPLSALGAHNPSTTNEAPTSQETA